MSGATYSWTDPRVWEVNAAGALTPEQRALIAGPPIRPPYAAWALLTLLAILEAGAAEVGTGPGGLLVDADPLVGAAATMAFILVVVGWQLLIPALIIGVPRWQARRRRRRTIRTLDACRIADAVGRVEEDLGRGAQARVGPHTIPVPEGAAALPPPGPYRLYWLESATGGPGPLLLSAEPLDDGNTAADVTSGRPPTEAIEQLPTELGENRTPPSSPPSHRDDDG